MPYSHAWQYTVFHARAIRSNLGKLIVDIAEAFGTAGWTPVLQANLDIRIWMEVHIFRTPNHDEEAIAAALVKVGLKGIEVTDSKLERWGDLPVNQMPDFVIDDLHDPLLIIVGSKPRFLPQYDPRFVVSNP